MENELREAAIAARVAVAAGPAGEAAL